MAGGEKLPKDPARNYYEAHWNRPATKKIVVEDPLLPSPLVEMGKLTEIQILRGPKLKFGIGNRLVYTTTADTRLHCVLTKVAMKKMLSLWEPYGDIYALRKVAKEVGGRQAKYPYPDVLVQVVGPMKHCVYVTEKGEYEDGDEPDGLSSYIHKFGELDEGSGELPYVCVDSEGRLWLAGGAYQTLRGGITG